MTLKTIWNVTAIDAASIPVKAIAAAQEQLTASMGHLKDTTVKVNVVMAQAAKTAKSFTSVLNSTATAATRAGRTLSLYVAAPLIAFGGLALKAAADFEKLRKSTEIITGSVAETAQMFDTLYTMAQKIPFAYKDIITSSRDLLVAGVIPKEIPHMMQMLADLAGAFGDKLKTVADILIHVEAVGRLNTNTARRFAKEGINLAAAYKKVYHIDTMKNATAWFEKATQAGIVTSKVVVQLLDSMTKKGGPAYLGAAKMSKTLSGATTILRSNIVVLLKNIGDWIDKSNDLRLVVSSLADTVFNISKGFVEFSKKHKILMRIALDLGVALIALASGLLAVGTAMKVVAVAQTLLDAALSPILIPIILFSAAIVGLGVAFYELYKHSNLFRLFVKSLIAPVTATIALFKLFGPVIDYFKDRIGAVIYSFKFLYNHLVGFKEALHLIGSVASGVINALNPTRLLKPFHFLYTVLKTIWHILQAIRKYTSTTFLIKHAVSAVEHGVSSIPLTSPFAPIRHLGEEGAGVLTSIFTPHLGIARSRSDVNINLRGETGAVKSVHTVHSMIHPGFNLGVNMEEAQ